MIKNIDTDDQFIIPTRRKDNNPENSIDRLIATNKAFSSLREYHYKTVGGMVSDFSIANWFLEHSMDNLGEVISKLEASLEEKKKKLEALEKEVSGLPTDLLASKLILEHNLSNCSKSYRILDQENHELKQQLENQKINLNSLMDTIAKGNHGLDFENQRLKLQVRNQGAVIHNLNKTYEEAVSSAEDLQWAYSKLEGWLKKYHNYSLEGINEILTKPMEELNG